MPNWCSNELTISGDKEAISRFVAGVNKDDSNNLLLIESYLPTPEDLTVTMSGSFGDDSSPEALELAAKQKSNIEKYGHKDWYDWNIANWGTKWSDSDTDGGDIYNDGTTVSYTFQSPWGPPEEAFRRISAIFPELTFVLSFSEEGMGFYGATSFFNGEVAAEAGGDISDIEGYDEIDFDSDDTDCYEKAHELQQDAREEAMRLVQI
jgi:hypothetical protein